MWVLCCIVVEWSLLLSKDGPPPELRGLLGASSPVACLWSMSVPQSYTPVGICLPLPNLPGPTWADGWLHWGVPPCETRWACPWCGCGQECSNRYTGSGSPIEAVWSHPRSSIVPDRRSFFGVGMCFGLEAVLRRPSPWQSYPSQWCPEILQTHGWWVWYLVPWSMRSMWWSLCHVDTKEEATDDWGESCFSWAKVPLPVLISWRPAPCLHQGIMQYESRIPHNRGSLDTMGFCHPGVPEILWCPWCQAHAWRHRFGRDKKGCAVCGGQMSSQCCRTGHERGSFVFWLWKKVHASWHCTQNLIRLPVSNIIFLPLMKMPIGSRGDIQPEIGLSDLSITILCLAALSQMQFNCAFWLRLVNNALLSRCAFMCK